MTINAVNDIYVAQDHHGQAIIGALLNPQTQAYRDSLNLGLADAGYHIWNLDSPHENKGEDWDGTKWVSSGGDAEVQVYFSLAPVKTLTGKTDADIIAGVTPTLPIGIKTGYWKDPYGVVHHYTAENAGLVNQTITEVNPPRYKYESTAVVDAASLATTTLGLRPNTIYVNTDTLAAFETDAAKNIIELEDGIFDVELELASQVFAVGTTVVDINVIANRTSLTPAVLAAANVESTSARLLAAAISLVQINGSDESVLPDGVTITPTSRTTVSITTAVEFSAAVLANFAAGKL